MDSSPEIQNEQQKAKPALLVELLATCFYLGKFPKAPGTLGTLFAIPIAYLFFQLGMTGYLVATVLFVLASIFISHAYESKSEVHDSKEIVIDEVAGYLITMALIPQSPLYIVLGFVLFRIFDIWKPGPIGYIDKKIKGGVGVVLDDVAAGLVSNIILQGVYYKYG